MRSARARFTVSRMMVAVAILAAVLWPGLAAYRVQIDAAGPWLCHIGDGDKRGTGEYHTAIGTFHATPFWPRYWRRLLGRPWPGTYVCDERCTKEWDGIGRLVVTVPLNPSTPQILRPDGSVDPNDPSAVAYMNYWKRIGHLNAHYHLVDEKNKVHPPFARARLDRKHK